MGGVRQGAEEPEWVGNWVGRAVPERALLGQGRTFSGQEERLRAGQKGKAAC